MLPLRVHEWILRNSVALWLSGGLLFFFNVPLGSALDQGSTRLKRGIGTTEQALEIHRIRQERQQLAVSMATPAHQVDGGDEVGRLMRRHFRNRLIAQRYEDLYDLLLEAMRLAKRVDAKTTTAAPFEELYHQLSIGRPQALLAAREVRQLAAAQEPNLAELRAAVTEHEQAFREPGGTFDELPAALFEATEAQIERARAELARRQPIASWAGPVTRAVDLLGGLLFSLGFCYPLAAKRREAAEA